MDEPAITINGVPLSEGQAMTVRVAISRFWPDLEDEDALGSDEHGRRMRAAYRERLTEVLALILRGPDNG